MKKIIYLSVLAAMTIAIAGCEPQGFEPDNDGKIIAIGLKEAVYVATGTPSMQIALKDNEELQLNVEILPKNAKNQKVIFSNLRPDLLTVTETGLLKPKAFGTDTLTVGATDGSGVSTRFTVVISDHMVKATDINVTAAGSNFELKINGNSFDLGACVSLSPEDTWNKTVTYTSNDESIATVTAAGIVNPVNIGATTITIRTTDGSNLSKDVNVVVRDLVIRKIDINRADWTVTTQTATGYEFVPDGTTGLPQHLLDENPATFLSLVKPGKSYSPIPSQPADFIPSFTVDMKAQKTFDYLIWQHRSSNAYNYLRVFGVNIEGSNDGSSFTPVNATGILWIPNKGGYAGSVGTSDPDLYRIDIPSSTYRYVRISLAMWSDIYDSQHPDSPGAGAKSGSTMQIAEMGLGYTVIE
jgi:hypothetical protein